MLKKATKALLALGAGFAMLLSAPASAATYVYYFDTYPGNLIGYQIYCDDGTLYEEWGVTYGVAIFDFNLAPYC